jgi:homoserine dehydrogenase
MTFHPKTLSLAVIGAGGVGKAFIEQLGFFAKRSNIKLLYLSTTRNATYNDDYAPLKIETVITSLHSSQLKPRSIPDLVEWLGRAPSACAIVDITSSQDIANQYPAILAHGISIVTPNKKAFSGSYDLWRSINDASVAAGASVFHEATVGAGLPIINTMRDLIDTGDKIVKIVGVFSGTMSYLFNSFAPLHGNGGRWSTQVIKARELGFTEPDPRDDLNGLDVARKLTILARIAGVPIASANSFPVESLVPEGLENCATTQDFLDGLQQYDDKMDEIKEAAHNEGMAVRYVGEVDLVTGCARVGLGRFERSHPIANLKGSDNIINFYTQRYKDSPLVIQGAGAGGTVTAMGVAGDVLRLLARQNS